MKYLAHFDEENKIEQSVKNHLEGVGLLSAKFCSEFIHSRYGEALGYIHDIGKYSNEFQEYLVHGVGSRGSVDHSSAGTQVMYKLFKKTGNEFYKISSMCIAGHHGGLLDYGDPHQKTEFCGRVEKEKIPNYIAYKSELDIDTINNVPGLDDKFNDAFSEMMLTRMLFSCLVDADFLDTEDSMMKNQGMRSNFSSMSDIKNCIDNYTAKFFQPKGVLNKRRCELLSRCQKVGDDTNRLNENLYTLTIPTGGGKTISSLAFAANRALITGRKRIIYAIPYTSIIEQNAKVFKDIVGDDNVVEHHMNEEYDDINNENISKADYKLKLATENWDAPLIVTTNVQFFESIFSNKTSKCRKLHNIANSIIIFDEAQMLPIQYLEPCLKAIEELVNNYNCCVVLCTATQPALEKLLEHKPIEIIENVQLYYDTFKRNNIKFIGEVTEENLIERLNKSQRVLCIASTKKKAQQLYQSLSNEEGVYHLSTNLCPKHRRELLNKIKKRLSDGEICRVVSTSLVEAGVDIDFDVVYKELDGLDSVIQAAGRCNREGKKSCSDSFTYVYSLSEDRSLYRVQEKKITKKIFEDSKYVDDLGGVAAVKRYFEKLYKLKDDNLDKKYILQKINADYESRFDFKSISRLVKLIEENTRPVIIPYDEIAVALIEKLRVGERSRELFRKLGQYTVNVRTNEFSNNRLPGDYEKLFLSGKIEKLDSEVSILIDEDVYDRLQLGLKLDCLEESFTIEL